MRAAIYVRISKDRDGESESPERQEAIARALAESKGWEVVRVYSDVDLSAYTGVHRPGYDELLKAVRLHDVDAVVVWSVTRLARTVREFSRLIAELGELKIELVSARESIDTSTATGRAVAQIHGVFAEMESATISSRVRDAHAYARAQGRMWTGGSRSFGWRKDRQDPKEAKIVREVAERLLAGESRESVARDLNSRAVRPAGGGKWWGSTVYQMVTSPVHAGYRIYEGESYEGNWEPILDRATHARLLAMKGSARRPRGDAPLASGLLVCGLCFHPMHRSKVAGGVSVYRCRKAAGWPGCGRLSINASKTEDYLRDLVLDFISASRLRPFGSAGSGLADLRAELAAEEQALAELSQDRYVRRCISAEVFQASQKPLDERITKLKAELLTAEIADSEAGDALPPGDRAALDEWWDSHELDDHRRVLRRALRQVVIHPVGKRGSAWKPLERIEPHWNYALYLDASGEVEPDEAEYARLLEEAEAE